MAKTQIKPSTGGSWVDSAGNNKSNASVSPLKPYAQGIAIEAANQFTFAAGTGARATVAVKRAAAVGVALQWV